MCLCVCVCAQAHARAQACVRVYVCFERYASVLFFAVARVFGHKLNLAPERRQTTLKLFSLIIRSVNERSHSAALCTCPVARQVSMRRTDISLEIQSLCGTCISKGRKRPLRINLPHISILGPEWCPTTLGAAKSNHD